MSFVMTIWVREGIVMAADSRLTLNREEKRGKSTVVNLAVGQSDANYKLFLSPCGIGISTYGAAEIKGVPIAGYVDSFMAELDGKAKTVEDVANKLMQHFGAFDPRPATQFHVAGYTGEAADAVPEVWVVDVAGQTAQQATQPGQQGAGWGGEGDILARLVSPVAQLKPDGTVKGPLPHFAVPWQFFTLQDAIDFAVFAVRSTIEAIRFQPRPKTVGGPIDVLVIQPQGANWIQRKELKVER